MKIKVSISILHCNGGESYLVPVNLNLALTILAIQFFG